MKGVEFVVNISLKFVPKGPVNNNPQLVQILAYRRSDWQFPIWPFSPISNEVSLKDMGKSTVT